MVEPQGRALLEVEGLTKQYGGERALDGVSVAFHAGEIHALLGENGAGKSTLAKIIAGATQPDGGELRIDGRQHRFDIPADAADAGIAMVYQETSLVETMTVAQNLFLSNAKPFNRIRNIEIRARSLLESHNFHIQPHVPVGILGAAQKQMVEIARAVHQRARVVIFDEPTSSVTPEEKRQLFMSMQRLRRDGVAVIFISHNIEEALEHADKVTVLRDGELQATRPIAELDRDVIVRMMVGRSVEYSRHPGTVDPAVVPTLEVDNITMGKVVQNMSFSLYDGQVTVLAGLVGSGRTEAAMVIFGAMKRRRIGGGTIRLEGHPIRYRTPRQAIRDGIMYVTEDRKTLGLFPDLTIHENIHVGHLGATHPLPPVSSPKKVRRIAKQLVDRFQIRALNPAKAKLVELSGGNQQKVLLAKSLTRTPKVVIFDEPTRGVDVGTIEDIHATIRDYAEQGVAVLVISSYLPEVLAVADRILVTRGGRVVSEFDAESATEEEIMYAAVH